jgi:lipoate-protein ligase A
VRPLRAQIATSEAAGGALNFARDDALMAAARESGEYAVRVYTWNHPTISFGRHERTSGLYSRKRASDAGLGVVRRRTGGRALLHSSELTYAIAGPADPEDTVTSTYVQLSDVLVGALRILGVPAEMSSGSRKENTEGAPCFATVTRGEIVANDRKLVASAQWRGDGLFLQHGSIMITDEQPLLRNALEEGRMIALGDSTTLDELGVAPSAEDVADALARAFGDRMGVAGERVAPGVLMDENVVRSGIARYQDADWTWRR